MSGLHCTICLLGASSIVALVFSLIPTCWQVSNLEPRHWEKQLLNYESVSSAPLLDLLRGWNTKPFIVVGVFEAN